MMIRPRWCQAVNEETPCRCGATASGKDPVRGVCQAINARPEPQPYIRLILTHKETGLPI